MLLGFLDYLVVNINNIVKQVIQLKREIIININNSKKKIKLILKIQ